MIRRVASPIFQIFSKGDNAHVDRVDPKKPRTFGMLVDAQDFYASHMEKLPLPLKNNFELVRGSKLNNPHDSNVGYIFDVHYPSELHDAHTDFPLAQKS